MRPAEGAYLRDRLPYGGGAAQQPEGDRGLGHPQEAGPGEREVHPPLGSQGGEYRHGAELHEPVQRGKRHGREIRHAGAVQLPSEVEEEAGVERLRAGQKGHQARAPRIPRLQLPSDERLRGGVRLGDTARGEQLPHEHRTSVPCGVHQDEHGAAGGAGQGMLHPGGHRREVSSSGRGHGRGDEP